MAYPTHRISQVAVLLMRFYVEHFFSKPEAERLRLRCRSPYEIRIIADLPMYAIKEYVKKLPFSL